VNNEKHLRENGLDLKEGNNKSSRGEGRINITRRTRFKFTILLLSEYRAILFNIIGKL
jgi:hypothetical protein